MGDLMNLREKIRSYKLAGSENGNLGYTRILLQVCGHTGHGKSSFINSLRYALLGGRFATEAPEASATASKGGFTRKRTSYPISDVIVVVDNRGFGKSNSYEKEEIYTQLANFQPLDEEVDWESCFEDRMKEITKARHNTNDLLLPIFIHSVECTINNEQKGELQEFLLNAQKLTGFLPIIILTKQYLGDVRTQQQYFLNLSMEKVFPVENYTSEDNIKTPEKDKTFLTILDQALDLVDFRCKTVSSFASLEEEHLNRVQMVLSIAHKNELESKLERLKVEWDAEHKEKAKKKPCKLQ